jgi:hypothetical protein
MHILRGNSGRKRQAQQVRAEPDDLPSGARLVIGHGKGACDRRKQGGLGMYSEVIYVDSRHVIAAVTHKAVVTALKANMNAAAGAVYGGRAENQARPGTL